MTDKDRLLTDDTVKSRTVLEFASGKGHAYHNTHKISTEHSAHDFIVKFSPKVLLTCSWNKLNLLLSMAMTKQQCMHACSGSPPDDNHLTSMNLAIINTHYMMTRHQLLK